MIESPIYAYPRISQSQQKNQSLIKNIYSLHRRLSTARGEGEGAGIGASPREDPVRARARDAEDGGVYPRHVAQDGLGEGQGKPRDYPVPPAGLDLRFRHGEERRRDVRWGCQGAVRGIERK